MEEPVTHSPRKSHIYRHPLPVRVSHWLNLVFLLAMLGSGLQIFNAHPALYWGSRSDPQAAWFSATARPSRNGRPEGVTRIFGMTFHTTGVLGVSGNGRGGLQERGFPRWATIPGERWLAMGRRWHFFFAWMFLLNGLGYVAYSVASGHLKRDLLADRGELRGIGRSFLAHLRLRTLREQSEKRYNVLQKLTYLLVIFVLAPLMVLAGLAMSPSLDAAFHWLPALFGGRQSARSIHFVIAFSLVAFVLVHVTMVILVGPVRHVRAMITGYLRARRGAP